MKLTNFKKINPLSLKKLSSILSVIYGIKKGQISISNDRELIVKRTMFLFFTRIFRINIYILLLEKLPKAFSIMSSGHKELYSMYKNRINDLLSGHNDELYNLENIIDFYYDILLDMDPVDLFYNLKKINLIRYSTENINETIETDDTTTVRECEYEEQGTIYILDTFLFGLRKKQLLKNIKKVIIASFLYIQLQISSFEDYKTNKIMSGFYFSKSPPFKLYPDLKTVITT